MSNALARLKTLIHTLEKQAHQIDQKNTKQANHRYLEDKPLFSDSLFSSRSDKFYFYVQELKKNINDIDRLITLNKQELSQALIQKIEQQANALMTALSANEALHHDAQIKSALRKNKNQQYKAIAKKIIAPSHALYSKLAEHHEFERRLKAMLEEKEIQRSTSLFKNSEKVSQEVLILHQRLGRCRQAISIIERDIELAEKRLV